MLQCATLQLASERTAHSLNVSDEHASMLGALASGISVGVAVDLGNGHVLLGEGLRGIQRELDLAQQPRL